MAEEVADKIVNFFMGIGKWAFGPENIADKDVLVIQILVFLFMYVVILEILNNRTALFKNQRFVGVIVSLVFAMFASYYMSRTQIYYGVLAPNTLMGLALVTIFPFMIFFLIVHAVDVAPVARQSLWGAFGIFFIYYIYKSLPLENTELYFYGLSLLLVGLAIAYDGQLHRYFSKKYKN